MMRYLTFISLALFLCSCSAGRMAGTGMPNPVIPEIQAATAHFRTTVTFGSNSITGLMAVKQRSDLAILGSFTNEFGVKGFDFVCADGKTELLYIMPALNRSMVKKILKRDISVLVGYGVGNIGKISSAGKGSSPLILYPDPSDKAAGVKDVMVSGSTNQSRIIFALEDFRYKLKIELVSLASDEK